MNDPSGNLNPPTPIGVNLLNCRFEKTNHFQSAFVVGAWGRISGHGEIILSMYNEIPELVSNAIYSQAPDGTWIGTPKLVFQSGSEGIVREIHVDLVLSLDAAKNVAGALAHWINIREKLELQKQQSSANPQQAK